MQIMTEMTQSGGARRSFLHHALGVGMAVLLLISAQAASATEAAQAEVKIDNFSFQPPVLRVKKGMTVTWVNHDDIPHSLVVAALQVRSHPIDTDDTFSVQFEKPGSYNYICGLHPHMKGQVVVSE
jgi:amicyanin